MTASTNIVRLQDMVRLSTPGALDGTIRMEVFNVLKEFFQRSDAWLLELTSVHRTAYLRLPA